MDANLRRGYLAERLGAYLLRPLAAVSEVPRPDDVGIDAIGTLLRSVDTRRLVPEASFYVQFKAASVEQVPYTRNQFNWLLELRLPLFFGRVQISDASIELYSGHILSRSLHAGPVSSYDAFEFSFEDSLTFGIYDLDKGKKLRLRTGPPVLRWSSNDVCDPEFVQKAYEIIRYVLAIEETNWGLRATASVQWMEWTTNQLPRCLGSASGGNIRGGSDITKALESAKSHYENILRNCIHANMDDGDIELHRRMIDYFRRHGVDPDPRNMFEINATETLKWLRDNAASRGNSNRSTASESEKDAPNQDGSES